jgi:hypothetical protein
VQRSSVRIDAHLMADVMCSLCSFLYLGSPKDERGYRFGKYRVTSLQLEAHEACVADVRPLCRIRRFESSSSRCTKRLFDLMQSLNSLDSWDDKLVYKTVADFSTVALPVDAARASVPRQAEVPYPGDVLKDPKRSQCLDKRFGGTPQELETLGRCSKAVEGLLKTGGAVTEAENEDGRPPRGPRRPRRKAVAKPKAAGDK